MQTFLTVVGLLQQQLIYRLRFAGEEHLQSGDLFMPVSGDILEVNKNLLNRSDVVNSASYTEGSMIKIKLTDETELNELLSSEAYQVFAI